MGNGNNTNASFDSNKVERRTFRPFIEQEYNLELNAVRVREAGTGTWQVSIEFRLRDGERYNNACVFETLNVTSEGFPVAVNRVRDMGIDLPEIKGTSAKNVAEKLAQSLPIGHKTHGRVYEQRNFTDTGFEYAIRGFLGEVK